MSKKFNRQFACSRMMLPEHCGSLHRYSAAKKRQEEQRRPLIDSQLQEEQQQLLEMAYREQRVLGFTLLTACGRTFCCGVPRRIDKNAGTIIIDTGNGKSVVVNAAEVIGLCPDF